MPDLSYISALGHVACLAASGQRHSERSFARWLEREEPEAAARVGELWARYRGWRDG